MNFLEVTIVQDVNGQKVLEALINNSSIAMDNSTSVFSSNGMAIGIFLILMVVVALVLFFFGGAIINFFFPKT